MSLENDIHFRIYTEKKTYEFVLQPPSTRSSRYSIITKNNADIDTINKLLQRVFDKNPSTIEELSRELRNIPEVKDVSVTSTSKAHTIGVQSILDATFNQTLTGKAALMDQRLQEYCSKRGFQCEVLVIDKGKEALKKGYGTLRENGDPISEKTPMPIGSLTKPIVGMAVLDLLAKGYFDDTSGPVRNLAKVEIVKFLPINCLPKDKSVLETWKSVSLLDLLNHTSGLPGFSKEFREQLMIAKKGKISNPVDPADVLSMVRNRSLKGGSEYCYSNFGYHLIGKIIEHVTGPGHSFENEINNFLSSKGLQNSGYVGTGSEILPNAMQWNGTEAVDIDPNELDPPSEAYSSGGLYSTVEDLAKLFGAINKSESLEHAGHVENHNQDFRPNYNCSLGWNYTTGSEQQEIWKNGAVGGFGSLMVIYPETNSGFIVLSNCQSADLEPIIGKELSEILIAETPEAAQQAIDERTKRMLNENKEIVQQATEEDLQTNREVAKAYWKSFVESNAPKDHSLLKHFLGGCYPDPLFIQNEFDDAVKTKNFNRFVALFEPLSVEIALNISKNEGLGD